MSLGGEPVYGVASESNLVPRPRLMSNDDMTRLTRSYLDSI
jgi:hypothetical protein